MNTVTTILSDITQLTLISLGFFSVIDYLRLRGVMRRDVALMFSALAISVFLSSINRIWNPETSVLRVVSSLFLITQPYLMLRLVAHFRRVPRTMRTFAIVSMGASWLLLGVYRSDLPLIAIFIIVVYFVSANGYAMLVLTQGALFKSGVVQKRLRFTAAGSGLLALALLIIGIALAIPLFTAIAAPLVQLVAISAVLAYYLGLATPRWLQQTWQLAELHHFLSRLTREKTILRSADVYQLLCERAIETTGAAKAIISQWSDQTHGWTLYDSSASDDGCALGSESVLEQSWRNGAAVAIPRIEFSPGESDCLADIQAELIYIVPLKGRRQVREVLLVFLEYGALFVNDDLNILSLFAEQCEIALENIGLVEEHKLYASHLEVQVEQRTAELRLRNQYISLLHQITAAANEATTIETPLQEAINRICEGLHLPIGHAFAPLAQAPSTLLSTSIWYLHPQAKYQAFRKATENAPVTAALASVQHFIRDGKPRWIMNVAQRPNFVRAEAAKEVGIQTGIYIPVFIESEVAAILELYSDRLIEPDEELLDILLQIGSQLGRVIERKRAEAAIRAGEAKFRALFETAPVAIVIIDNEGKLRLINDKVIETFGYTESELLNQPLELLLPPRLQAIHSEHRQYYFSNPQSRPMGGGLNLIGQRKDGTEFPIEVGLSYIETGEEILGVGFISDMTAQKQATEALLESERRYHRIIDNMIEGFQIIGPNWRYLYLNDSAAHYGRIPKEEMLGKTLMEKYPGIEDTEMYAALRMCLDEQVAQLAEFEFVYPDGSIAWFKFSIQPIPEGIFVLSLDITERKQAEAAMRHLNAELEQRVQERTAHLVALNKELESFSYSVSHDLRAPLRAVDGFSQALLEDYNHKLDDEGKEFLNLIRAESQRMGQLIDDLIQLSRYTRTEIKSEKVDLSAIAQAIAHDLQQQNPQRQVQFVIEAGLIADGDAGLLRVVLSNLLGNAWKYSAKQANTRIEFGSKRDDGKVQYYVRDDGVGFDMAYVHKLFGAFQRLHRRDEFEGTGIGLATVQRIIHRHGGTVRAEGAVDQGAAFYFTLGAGSHENE